jgi:hypothetical protein
MATYIRVISAIASILILAACASTAPKLKPTAAGVGAAARNPACLDKTAGSKIAANGASCSTIVLSISSDDVNRNGATTAGEAIRFNVPFATINH